MARGKKVRPRAWTPRDRQDCRRLFDACDGDRDEFDRRVDDECRQRPKRGRKSGSRRFVSDKEFLAVLGDWFASTSHRKRVEFIEREYQANKKQSEVETLLPAVREAWDPRRSWGGGTAESITRRLERQLPKRPGTRKATRKTKRM